MNTGRFKYIFLILLVLFLVSIACNLPFRGAQGTEELIPVTTEAAIDLQQKVDQAATDFEAQGAATLAIGEDELTSFLALELQKQPDPILHSPQVYLRDGQVQITADLNQGGMDAPLGVALGLSADPSGNLQYEVLSAKLGPFPLPDSMLDELTDQIDNLLAGAVSAQIADIYLDDITIANGQMILSGHAR